MASPTQASSQAVLETRGLVLAYADQPVLSGLDLSVQPGEFLAVLALGGAGKSVLFRTLIGLEKPTAGRVFWFGHDIMRLSERQKQQLRRRIGAVHQHGALFADLNVEENIKLPLAELTDHDADHIENTVRFTLEVAGLWRYRHTYPAALPAVMVRKAALARALVLGPRLLVCDDVFAGLDPKARRQINDYIRALHMLGAMATVILTHNVTMALRLADRIAILEDGRIVISGPPEEIQRSTLPAVVSLLRDDE